MISLVLFVVILNFISMNALMDVPSDEQCPEFKTTELNENFNVFLLLDDADYFTECFVKMLHKSDKLTVTLQYHQPPNQKVITNLENYDVFIFQSKYDYTPQQLENMEIFKYIFKFKDLRKVFIFEVVVNDQEKFDELTIKNLNTLVIKSDELGIFGKIFLQTNKVEKYGMKKERDKYLGGQEFRVTLFHCPPFVYVNENDLEIK